MLSCLPQDGADFNREIERRFDNDCRAARGEDYFLDLRAQRSTK
jgi:hypothetical protein